MNFIKLLTLSFLFITITSCGDDDTVKVSDLPDRSWEVQLNGEDFTVSNTGFTAYYDAFDGDLIVVGSQSVADDERIVLTFSVDNGPPFVDGQSLDMGLGSGNSLLYNDDQKIQHSSHYLGGSGSFLVDKYIETETRNFLSGTVNGVLFNEVDSTSVTVTGYFAVLTL